MATLTFRALDDSIVSFPVPKGVNRFLVLKAVEKMHKGLEPDLVDFGLTRAETEMVAEIVATLEEHRTKSEAAR